MKMTTALMGMKQDKEDLGGGTDDRGSVDVVGAAYIPGAATPEWGLVRSGAKAFLPDVPKERRLRRWGVNRGGGDALQGETTALDVWERT